MTQFAFRNPQPEETETERKLRERGFDPAKLRRQAMNAKQNQQNNPTPERQPKRILVKPA